MPACAPLATVFLTERRPPSAMSPLTWQAWTRRSSTTLASSCYDVPAPAAGSPMKADALVNLPILAVSSALRSPRAPDHVRKTLRTHCPTGVNVYFDNVGGDILDIALTQVARHARDVAC